MRLPHSRITPPCPCFSSIVLVIAVAAGLSLCAHATTPNLVFSPPQMRFGTVLVGQSETQTLVVTNAGSSSMIISAISVSGSQFRLAASPLPLLLQPGERVALSFVFAPSETGWTGEEEITFIDDSSTPVAQVRIAGVGVNVEPLIATPSSISFGNVAVGSTAENSVVLKNATSTSYAIRNFNVLGSGFSISHPALPLTLAPGQSLTFTVIFAPKSAGLNGAGIFVSGPSVNIPVTGTGTSVGQLAISPGALSFGSVDIGATSKQSLSMTATSGTVIVSSATSSNSQFTVPGTSFPLTISAGQSVSLDVVFSPTQSGASSGKLTFAADSSNPPSTESLTGTGAQPQYSVSLSWSPSTSAVAGYNIYRGLAVGSYSRLNSSLNTNTTYADSTVVSGNTYYYAATAVNSSGAESGYSAPVKVVVP